MDRLSSSILPQSKWYHVWQVVYVGDGNNIVHSWIRLAAKFNFEFVCACPKGFEPDAATIELANGSGAGRVSVSYDPMEVQACSISASTASVCLISRSNTKRHMCITCICVYVSHVIRDVASFAI